MEVFAVLGSRESSGAHFLENAQQERIFNGPAMTVTHLGNLRVIGTFKIPAIFTENFCHIKLPSYLSKVTLRLPGFAVLPLGDDAFPAAPFQVFRFELGASNELAPGRHDTILGLAQEGDVGKGRSRGLAFPGKGL
jgi:hypothetical protein